MSVGLCNAHGGPKRILDPLELGYKWLVMSKLMVLGTGLWSPGGMHF